MQVDRERKPFERCKHLCSRCGQMVPDLRFCVYLPPQCDGRWLAPTSSFEQVCHDDAIVGHATPHPSQRSGGKAKPAFERRIPVAGSDRVLLPDPLPSKLDAVGEQRHPIRAAVEQTRRKWPASPARPRVNL